MTRDELIEDMAGEIALRLVTTGDYGRDTATALMERVDSYVQAERERVALAVEARADGARGCSRGCASGERRGLLSAAEIVRKGGSADE